jgi:hypothetical protein
VASWLGIDCRRRGMVYLVPDLAAMRALAPGAPDWSVAVTTGDPMVFRLDLVDKDPSNGLGLVLKHEMVHFVLNELPRRFPRWFEEGLAVHNAGVAQIELDTTLERYAAARNLPRLADADKLFEGGRSEAALGYKLGQRVVDAFVSRFGERAVPRLVRAFADGLPFPEAFQKATGVSLPAFEERFRKEVTPVLPFWLYLIVENLELSILCAAGVLVILGYIRWRIRRERAMSALGGGPG